DIIGNNEVEFPVIVVIEPGRTGRPQSSVLHACVRRHVGEGAVSVVVIEDASAVTKERHVRKAVIVVVADANPHSEKSCGSDSGVGGHGSKCAVAIISVESAAQG